MALIGSLLIGFEIALLDAAGKSGVSRLGRGQHERNGLFREVGVEIWG